MRHAVAIACALGCGGAPKAGRDPGVHHEYDVLLERVPHEDDDRPDPASVELARRALVGDSRVAVRRAAIRVLTDADDILALFPALDDPDRDVMLDAASEVSGLVGDYVDPARTPKSRAALRAHAPAVRALLVDADAHVRERALAVLFSIGDSDIALAPLLRDTSVDVRGTAIELGFQRAALAADDVAALRGIAMGDPNRKLREIAINLALAKAPAADAVAMALAGVASGDAGEYVADQIGQRHLVAGVPVLLAYLRTHPEHAHTTTERTRYILTLGSFQVACALPALVREIGDPDAPGAAEKALGAYVTSTRSLADVIASAKLEREDVPPCKP